MDRQHMIDVMLNRDYCLHSEEGAEVLFFRHVTWTSLTGKVIVENGTLQLLFLSSDQGSLLTVSSMEFPIDDAQTYRKVQAAMVRAMINLGVRK